MLTIGTLANIKHILQKELFNANGNSGSGERLLSVVTVTKTFKKKDKRACYLCVVTTAPPVPVVTLCLVKQSEQRESEYKRKRSWQLDEIKWIDGRNEQFETHEFDIQLEKLYKWYALNLHERQNFLAVLNRQIQKYVRGPHRAEFRNVPLAWLSEKSPEKLAAGRAGSAGNAVQKPHNSDDEDDEEEAQEFTALTDKEANELGKLFSECDFAIKDAEQFIEQLSKELHDLDGANMQSVLASEQKVLKMMEHIDNAITEADKFETRLDSYEDILGHVKETMEKIGGKNAMIEIANNNNIKLMRELNKVISQLDLPHSQQQALDDPDLKTAAGRKAAITAAQCLQQAMNSDIDPTLLRLEAVQDQRKRFEKWKQKFSATVSRFLNNLFIHLGNEIGDMPLTSTELTLPNHSNVHRELTPYTELMHWSKAMDRKTYDGLMRVYTASLSKIYDRDVRNFFNLAKLQVSDKLRSSREDLDMSSSSRKSAVSTIPYGTLGINREQWGPGVDSADRVRFDALLEKVLAELEPIALQEQLFCINFFQMDVISPTTKNTQTTLEVGKDKDKGNEMSQSFNASMVSPTDGAAVPQKRLDRQINEDVRKLMMGLFGCLEPELVSFIQSFERVDSFYSLYVLVRLTQHVMSAQDTHSFLSMTFASALVQVKRNFDRFMQQQLQSIKEAKLPKRSKAILPYVENFENFAQTAEGIFRKSDRRTDMEKWYLQLVNAIFEGISMHSQEHPKTPSQVVRMENYHHMYALLAQLKVPGLDALKKEAKLRYNDALKAYVTQYFGRPLEKLNQFFEGVQQKVAQGVKETEISYQMAFSKQELRKVISQYPAREVKKGLENLYKKVDKHLCEEENLLQVVWHAMQEEFIAQYNYLEERIQKCYAGAMINLEFNIQDILAFFSDIARSH
ncbi:exocyst complex component 1 [Drosophila sulfurigaster albostrigata]|uniref:exocyst complex component 1 n=1 Tax=Drosophila sulfurigaster albostrigata TaxID=89887 RepID=UPI002D21C734|nr:exocyst complex component 1 [Drosophila sulfurigaster albostrigata]